MLLRTLRAAVITSLAVVGSCSPTDTGTSQPASSARQPSAVAAVDKFRRISTKADLRHASTAYRPFVPVGDGFVVSWGGSSFVGLSARLPRVASGTVHLARPDRADVRIEILADDLGDAPGTLVDGLVAFSEAATGTDVFYLSTASQVEEFRLVSTARDRIEARYHIRVGSGLSVVRAREHRIEVVDRTGYVHLATAPIFAVDSTGARRDAEVEVVSEGGSTFLATVRVDARELAFPVLLDPGWSSAATPYYDHSVGPNVLLKSGEVMATAGSKTGIDFKLTELYAPATNSWSIVGSFSSRRVGHALSLLTSGKVLATGGTTGSGISSEAELYDPSPGSWSLVAAMSTTRTSHTSTALSGGRVLVVGGTGGSTAEVYDEATNTWTKVGSLSLARTRHAATLLASGKVLVVGGYEGTVGSLSSAEIYDPATKTWAAAGSMTTVRQDASAITLVSGKVLVAGGHDTSPPHSTAELYDPATNTWSAAGPMATARQLHGCVLLTDGTALVAGGLSGTSGVSSAEIYSPSTNTWSSAGAMPSPHVTAGLMTRLIDGRTLVLDSTTALLYDPSIAPGTCVFDTDCKTTEYCVASKCTAKVATGGACTSAPQCLSGFCVGSICCGTACSGACPGGVCSVSDAGTDGGSDAGADAVIDAAPETSDSTAALKKIGAICLGNGECESGHCADAICCDVPCDGQCQACDLKGKEGACSTVSGAPHGARPSCGDDPTCLGKCDGLDAQKCAYPAAATPCTGSCVNGIESVKACDGKGSCQPTTTASCNGAICDGPKCKSSCAGNGDCLGGFACGPDGKCVPASAAAPVEDGGGCGCVVPGRADETPKVPLGVLIGLLLTHTIRSRRRRRLVA